MISVDSELPAIAQAEPQRCNSAGKNGWKQSCLPNLAQRQSADQMIAAADGQRAVRLSTIFRSALRDNVDAGGILPALNIEPTYLMAVLNGPVAEFVFRIISKPFLNNYRSTNKQFIALLPVPKSTSEQRSNIASRARRLQERWTERRDLPQQAGDRLFVLARARHPASWLWPDLPSLPELIEKAPRGLRLNTDRQRWATERLDEIETARVEALQAALDRGGRRQARFESGELRLYASGTMVLGRIFLDPAAGGLVEAYWQWLLLKGPSREAKAFSVELRRPPAPSSAPAAAQFVERVAASTKEVAAIDADERELNETLYGLYALTPDERNLVENEPGRRSTAPTHG